jgi:hypothetical protein
MERARRSDTQISYFCDPNPTCLPDPRQTLVDKNSCTVKDSCTNGIRSHGYRDTRVPCEEIDLLADVGFQPPLPFLWVGFLFLLALPVQRCSISATRSAALVQAVPAVVGRNEELQAQKATQKTSLD